MDRNTSRKLKFDTAWWTDAGSVLIVKAANFYGVERYWVVFDLSQQTPPGVSMNGWERFVDALTFCHERGLKFSVCRLIDCEGSLNGFTECDA